MLTNLDIDLLLKALDAYQSKFINNSFTSALIGLAVSKENQDAAVNKAMEKVDKGFEESKKVEETVILLKAKLIQMRDKATISEAEEILKA